MTAARSSRTPSPRPAGLAAAGALLAARDRGRSTWLGLMSGTSGDGIDAARVTLEETAEGPRVVEVLGDSLPFPPEFARALCDTLSGAGSFAGAAHWNRVLGERFAEAAVGAIARHGDVDAIALSGHTFAHLPTADPPATLPLGDPAVVAERTGRPVLSGFRTADIARGGEGAPLVPAGDRVLFGALGDPLAVVNIGGISNVTWLARGSDPAAADAGPGNLVLNAAFRDARPDGEGFDRGGELAAAGVIDRTTLDRWDRPSSRLGVRRSYGREEFGIDWWERERPRLVELSLPDRLATLTAWVAREIAATIARLGGGRRPARLLVGGGGAHHRRLVAELAAAVGVAAEPLGPEHGVDADLREAAAFAILGHEWLYGRPASFPGTTGATPGAGLGSVTFPGGDRSDVAPPSAGTYSPG